MDAELLAQIKINNGKTIQLVKGDITERNVDALINAANSYLKHGGGVAAAIVRKGGNLIQQESDKIGFVSTGSVVVTSAGKLPSKAVIHTVGPKMGEDEDNKLRKAVQSSLILASERGFKSVSMPAISSGIYGFPKDRCANILVDESMDFLKKNDNTSIETVEFCIVDNETLDCFRSEFDNKQTTNS
jgi:O-acetyl-ADP-ribose deacetylase